MNVIKKTTSILLAVVIGISLLGSTPVYADGGCGDHFLGLRAWYDGLVDDDCEVLEPIDAITDATSEDDAVAKYTWKIVMNVISMILGIVGYLAICFVIWGGIQYMLAQGDVSKVARGKKTVTNSIIGLIIVMTASIISGAISDIIEGAKGKGDDFFLEIFNQAFLWGGIVAVVMIVWGGIQYIMSTGNPSGIAKAKNTILYSAIGLLIVIFAATIINTVVGAL